MNRLLLLGVLLAAVVVAVGVAGPLQANAERSHALLLGWSGDHVTTTLHLREPKKEGRVKIEVAVFGTDHQKLGCFGVWTVPIPSDATASQKAASVLNAVETGIEITDSLNDKLQAGSLGGSVTIAGTPNSGVGSIRVNLIDSTAEQTKVSDAELPAPLAPPGPQGGGAETLIRPMRPLLGDGGWQELGVKLLLFDGPAGTINGEPAWISFAINENPPHSAGYRADISILPGMSRLQVAEAVRDRFRALGLYAWTNQDGGKVFLVIPGFPEITDVELECADDTLNAGYRFLVNP